MTKQEKLMVIMMLLDIVESYTVEALPGTVQEYKKAIKEAIVANKRMTRIGSKYLGIGDIGDEFGQATDELEEIISTYMNKDFEVKFIKKE